MARVVLGLDIGGANLKAATVDCRAASVPFPLWKQPDRLPAALAELIARFPDTDGFAVTMTGELCDCFATKREGVNAILNAVQAVSRGRPVRVWGTDGRFRSIEDSRNGYRTVAAANWHALATLAGGYAPRGSGLLIDIGSTTTDLVPIRDGEPQGFGQTDVERMRHGELVYTGARRTPVCALLRPEEGAAEFFATVLDIHLLLGHILESPDDTDTADGRPAMRAYAHARLCRMLGGDAEEVSEAETRRLAESLFDRQLTLLQDRAARQVRRILERWPTASGTLRLAVVSGSGEFLARRVIEPFRQSFEGCISLNDRLGPSVSACAPAYAVAVLATDRPA